MNNILSVDSFIAEAKTTTHEIALSNIARKAEYLSQDAESIQRYVRMIERGAGFDDSALQALTKAETDLHAVLLVVKLAKSALSKKRRHLQAAE